MENSDYVARITTAGPLGLVIITYELTIDNLEEAVKTVSQKMDPKAHIHKSRQCLTELMTSLNMDYGISRNLMSIYIYVNNLIIQAGIKCSVNKYASSRKLLNEAVEILSELLRGWKAIEESGNTGNAKLMENAQHVYAGLTYKGGRLAEYIDTDVNRGFKA